jgi:regulation of enolase protein 1 (concanavalin A-like superfamily)
LIRENADCRFKCSAEYENETVSRLGSVLTNAGYSDWATQDISSRIKEMSYEVEFSNRDLIARFSPGGADFKQMRIGHLQSHARILQVGIYGCSPVGEGFTFDVIDLQIVNL